MSSGTSTQTGPLYDYPSPKSGKSHELCEPNRAGNWSCPIHGSNPGWNLGTLYATQTKNVDGDTIVSCPICFTQGLLPKGT